MNEQGRVFMFAVEIPALNGLNWAFEFTCTIYPGDTQDVVVEWHDTSMGSGLFRLENCSTVWLQNFKIYSLLHQMALEQAFLWNALEQAP